MVGEADEIPSFPVPVVVREYRRTNDGSRNPESGGGKVDPIATPSDVFTPGLIFSGDVGGSVLWPAGAVWNAIK
jgi:hypothetical protein